MGHTAHEHTVVSGTLQTAKNAAVPNTERCSIVPVVHRGQQEGDFQMGDVKKCPEIS